MSSLENKTIRPGSFKGYAYYYSNRQPAQVVTPPRTERKSKNGLLLLAVLIVLGGFAYGYKNNDQNKSSLTPSNQQTAPVAASNQNIPVPTHKAAPVENCAGNTEPKLIKVNIEHRHLWACEGSKTVHDAAVITGLRNHAETETPPGSYHIYAKQQDTTLSGADSRGEWKYPVHYWQPFLDNQYGTYGFHDATWRPDTDFGNVSPDSEEASHGCVELNLANSKWLYEWSAVKTPVLVES